MNWKLRFKFRLFKFIEPIYLRLQFQVQFELNRIARLKALAEGTRLWKKLQNKKGTIPTVYRDGVSAVTKYHQDMQARVNPRGAGCLHLKGGRGPKTAYKDYAVYRHMFPDGSMRIKCTLCSKAWYSSDSDWKDAVKMTEQSTNSASSSEISSNLRGNNGPNHLSS